MLPTLCAVARALLSTAARSSPAAAEAPATCARERYASALCTTKKLNLLLPPAQLESLSWRKVAKHFLLQ